MSGSAHTDATYATDLLPLLLLPAGFGLAIPALTTFAAAGTADRAGPGEAAALTAGYRSAFAVAAGLVVVAAVVAVALLRPQKGDALRGGATRESVGSVGGGELGEFADAHHAGDR